MLLILGTCIGLVDFDSILEIRMGQNTKEFQHYKKMELEDRAFSIIYVTKGRYKTLNLLARDKETCTYWVQSLQVLLAREFPPTLSPLALSDWIKSTWDSIDVSGENSLDLDQITALMKKLNVLLSKREIKSNLKLQAALTSLDFNQFQQLYRNIKFRVQIL